MRMQRQNKGINQHSQIFLPVHLWILFGIQFISISPYSCSGTYAHTDPTYKLISMLSHIAVDFCNDTLLYLIVRIYT